MRAMLPASAENNWLTIPLFNSACSKIAQSSVLHARKPWLVVFELTPP
jgi:hypothetical protein